MRTYLDNNATTQIHPRVLEKLLTVSRETWGNASSVHEDGQRARRCLEEARESVASFLKSTSREIVFTSGGTESNNTALSGLVLGATKRCHFVTGSLEHPSVREVMRRIEGLGHEVTWIKPDRNGVLDASEIAASLRADTRGVALMLANNETGAIQPAAAVGAVCHQRRIHFHCDAVQAAGRIPIDVTELQADTLSISAHKMHGPKGIGALYIRAGTVLEPLLRGGAQERRRRAGTESVPLAAAFGEATELASSEPPLDPGLRDDLEKLLRERFTDLVVNSSGARRLPNTSSLLFPGLDAEGLVIALDLAGVAVSTGSACSSGRVEPSHVLLAMGLSEEDARSSVRVSTSRFTTTSEIEKLATLLTDFVPRNSRPTIARS
ncbi:MAG TPA: cysteine desulfurase family protein [Thermoanaerobaculia bacterium]|nr:cysteine desulfurase family protein [Thermoanaerobaculia bacterium]